MIIPVESVALAVNPTSGSGRGHRFGAAALERLRAGGLDVALLQAPDAERLSHLVRAGLDAGLGALVVVGGDGIVTLGVNAVAGTGTPLGVIPAGTGNDIARALGVPLDDPDAAAAQVLAGLAEPRPVDAVRCRPLDPDATAEQTRWFAGVLGAGFDAVVNERANRWRHVRGRLRYDLALLRELPVFRPRHYDLELDGEAWSTAAMLVAVANAPSYGGGMQVCPDARIDDGLLDVLVVRPVSRTELVRIFPRVYSGRHVSHPAVEIRRARRVTVRAESIVTYADGERFAPLPLECTVVPGALRLLAGGNRSPGAAVGDPPHTA